MDNQEDIFEYDELKMYFGELYQVTDKITILQPSIGDILEFGDKKFYSIVSTLCANPTMFRLQLWDMGIDWNEIDDFQLFIMLSKSLTLKETYLLFGDLNFSWFEPFVNQRDNSITLINIPRVMEVNEYGELQVKKDSCGNEIKEEIDLNHIEKYIIIDELVYMKIVNYIRHMFDIHPKVEKAKNKATKEAIIDEERMNLEIEKQKNKNKKNDLNKSPLFPMISAMINHPGFKYKKNELREVGIVEFMDSVKRLQTYESVRALMSGMYSGMIDTSKMDLNKELNWARDLYEK